MSDEIRSELEALRKSDREIARKVVDFFDRVDRLEERMAKDRRDFIGKLADFAGEVDASRNERRLFDFSFNTLHDKLARHEMRISRLEGPGESHGTKAP